MTQLAIDITQNYPLCQKEEGRTALWRSVRSVVNSQRQAPPLQPVSRTGSRPLSFAQERIMLLQQIEPDSSTYNKSIVQRLKGPLNVAALEQSFNELMRRHDVLRTTFTMVDGQAFQRGTDHIFTASQVGWANFVCIGIHLVIYVIAATSLPARFNPPFLNLSSLLSGFWVLYFVFYWGGGLV